MKRKTYHRLYPAKPWRKYPEDKFFKFHAPIGWPEFGIDKRLAWVDDFINKMQSHKEIMSTAGWKRMVYWAQDLRAELTDRIGRKG